MSTRCEVCGQDREVTHLIDFRDGSDPFQCCSSCVEDAEERGYHLDVFALPDYDGEAVPTTFRPAVRPEAKPWWRSFEEDGLCGSCGGRNDKHARWCEMRKNP